MKYKIHIVITFILITQFSACRNKELQSGKKKENMNEEKFD